MAFQFVAAAHYNSAGTASAVVDVPTGTTNNDLTFMLTKHNAAEDVNSGLSGWTQIGASRWSGSAQNQLFYRVASSEPSTYTVGWATSARTGITIVTFRDGFDTGDPIDVASTMVDLSDDANVNAGGITVSAADSPLIYFGFLSASSSTTFTPPTNPATFTEHVDTWNTDARFARHVSSVIWSGSGATGDVVGTASATTVGETAWVVALNPSAGGGTDPEGRVIGGKLTSGGLLLGGVLVR
jgi:hypothetical protein